MTVKYCYLHKVSMPEKTSKNKQNPDGSYKVYNSHLHQGAMCFGKGEAPKEDKQGWVEENIGATEEMVADVKAEQEMEKDLEATKAAEESFGPEVEDKPMTRLDWNIKEFIKGLGVFSSAARSEGMDPKAAFENMAIWEWMDLAYGDMPGYEEWKEKAKGRIK